MFTYATKKIVSRVLVILLPVLGEAAGLSGACARLQWLIISNVGMSDR